MPDRQQTYAKVLELIEPFNKKGVAITEATRFAQDLEWDSLTVLDFVANDRGRVRRPHHDEHAGRDRDRRPAGRRAAAADRGQT